MTIQLGPFQLDHPFILAPMAGITNSPFRRLMRRRGSSMVISELISSNGIEYLDRSENNRTKDLLRFHESERPVGIQIFGEVQNHLVKAAQVVEILGADFVDLNMGCPVPKVVSKGGGAAMSKDLPALFETLQAMVRAVKIPVTIKIRTGWDQSSRNAIEVVRVAEDAGVRWVAIHGRTRAQGYSGHADWDFISEVKRSAKIPIIGNGDLSTAEKAMTRFKESGVDAVLIGRGALRNPFIFTQASALYHGEKVIEPTAKDYLSFIEEQKTYLEEVYVAKEKVLLHLRKFLAWYSSGFPNCHEFRRSVFSEGDFEKLWGIAQDFFETHSHNRDQKFLNEDFLMGGHG